MTQERIVRTVHGCWVGNEEPCPYCHEIWLRRDRDTEEEIDWIFKCYHPAFSGFGIRKRKRKVPYPHDIMFHPILTSEQTKTFPKWCPLKIMPRVKRTVREDG